ncbi:hypothetical protein O6H91_02G078100 [Diphasiastrum complanatum]|uniref:Uncharacterized protein n=1 Tax=Diphasiastrum complanatum TaxID=34168 RepID=A0ACC2EH74_DIPCM|nr:hypothetical protein O6H91_02G078100 [Diphasiastrum complanatum]
MSTFYGGSLELDFPLLDPSLSSAFGGTASLLSELPSGAGIQRADPWLTPFSSSVGSMHKVFPGMDSQQHFIKQSSTACHLPSYAAPVSSFSPIPNFQVNPLLLPFQNQANGLRMTRSSLIPQNYVDNILFRDRGRQSSLPCSVNGASLLLHGQHGDSIDMANFTSREVMDAKALAASKSHSEAERRRRERINTHLVTLRSLLPNTTKELFMLETEFVKSMHLSKWKCVFLCTTDKASLLAEVIQHVKELKRQTAEIAEGGPIPSDVDELCVDTDLSSDEDRVLIKASLCCADRPGLLSDLIKTLRNLKLQMVKAEISTLCGRVKNVILLTSEDTTSAKEDQPTLRNVQEALRAVMDRSGSSELSPLGFGSNKRQKLGS